VDFFKERGIIFTPLGECVIDNTIEKEKGFVIGDCSCRFLEPVFFDDILEIITAIDTLTDRKIIFSFTCYNKTRGNLCAQGHMTLIYVDLKMKKSTSMPQKILSRLRDLT
jgi:acyl-CoA thioesterase FadM